MAADPPRDPLATSALAVVAALAVGIGVYRIPAVDIPWHLATGRLILRSGAFPVTNTFSWTFPDHPLHQQYPLFQVPLALLVDHAGWGAVTAVNAALWALGIGLWARWAGTWREAAQQPLLWLLVVLGVQRHHVPRPEVLTLVGLGALLVAIDAWRTTRSRWALAGVVAAQWVMVNGHQMWPLGVAVTGSLLVHLAIVRLAPRSWTWLDRADADLPVWPTVAGFAASIAVLAVSPLGLGVYTAPLTTLDTLLSQGQATAGGAQAAELAPVWTDPLSTGLAVALAATALGWTFAARRRVYTFDLAILLMGAVMVAAAIRGMPFAAVAMGAVAARARGRTEARLVPGGSPVTAAAALAAIAVSLAFTRVLVGSAPACERIERGFGRAACGWGERTVAFVQADPPPGELLNLGWVAGNPLILGLYPEHRVFVDPRWEAYPRAFLLDAIAGIHDGDQLAALIDRFHPAWIVAETREPDAMDRVAERVGQGWAIVHADAELVVIVDPGAPGMAAWLDRHPELAVAEMTADWSTWPVVRAQQQVRFAHLLGALGDHPRASALVAEAATVDDPAVTRELDKSVGD